MAKLEKTYELRVIYQNGNIKILKFGKNKIKRDLKAMSLRKDKSVKEVATLENWE